MVNIGRVVSVSSRLTRRSRIKGSCPCPAVGFVPRERNHVGSVIPNSGTETATGFRHLRGFYSFAAKLTAEEGSDAPVTFDFGDQLSEKDYHRVANETLHRLQEKMDELGEQLTIDGFDCDYAEGVLTVRLGDRGTYVINKQTPNRQIWLSSPVSGPSRFDWLDSKWVYRRTKSELHGLLQEELGELLGCSINLS